MSVVINNQTIVQNPNINSTTIIGGNNGISPLPYIEVTYSLGSTFTSDTDFKTLDDAGGNESFFPLTWPLIDWGDGTIERNVNGTTSLTHNYNAGTYTARFYNQSVNLNSIKKVLLDGNFAGSNQVVLNFNLKSTPNVTSLICAGLDPITSFDVSYLPLLQTFDFSFQDNIIYTAGNLGQYNPLLRIVDLSGGTLSATEVNQILVDLQTYCLNNRGSVSLGGGTNAAPTTGPPNGIAAKAALEAAGWTVSTN